MVEKFLTLILMHNNCSQDHLQEDMNNELTVQFRDDRLCHMLESRELSRLGFRKTL